MSRSYSLDLRQRVVQFVEAGHSRHAAAERFGVSVSFAVKLMATYRATGSLAPKPEGGWRYSKLDPHRDIMFHRDGRDERPHHAATGGRTGGPGTKVAPASISRWFRRQGYRVKKRPG
jgi:transposase